MAETSTGRGISPYLTIDGAPRAIAFYKTVFAAEDLGIHMADDGQRVMHAALRINGGLVMVSDSFPEFGDHPPPDPNRGSPVSISLALDDRSEVDRLHKRALDHGATTLMDPMDAFWGARFAMFTDPFGHRWMLNAEVPKQA
jgi:PhnB protein